MRMSALHVHVSTSYIPKELVGGVARWCAVQGVCFATAAFRFALCAELPNLQFLLTSITAA
jgi:hypothetical protein